MLKGGTWWIMNSVTDVKLTQFMWSLLKFDTRLFPDRVEERLNVKVFLIEIVPGLENLSLHPDVTHESWGA